LNTRPWSAHCHRAAGRRQQRLDLAPGLIGELRAADRHLPIEKPVAARTYNTAVRQALGDGCELLSEPANGWAPMRRGKLAL
jgi:hypothetical protein